MTTTTQQTLKDLENVLVQIVIEDASLKSETLVAIGYVVEELQAIRKENSPTD